MTFVYDLMTLVGYFLVMIVFVVAAILCAKSVASWIVLTIGSVIQLLSLLGTQRNYNYWGIGDEMTRYWLAYFLLLIVGIAAISARRKAAKEREEQIRQEENERREREAAQNKQDAVVTEEKTQNPLKKVSLEGMVAFNAFVEESKDGKNFGEILTLWKGIDVGDQIIYDEILQSLTAQAKTERLYGSSPRECVNYLDSLVEKYGNKETN